MCFIPRYEIGYSIDLRQIGAVVVFLAWLEQSHTVGEVIWSAVICVDYGKSVSMNVNDILLQFHVGGHDIHIVSNLCNGLQALFITDISLKSYSPCAFKYVVNVNCGLDCQLRSIQRLTSCFLEREKNVHLG